MIQGPVVAIVGPTASGKSSLAERVACELGSSVVSVDAMQVYRGMDIGTAKEPPEERRCHLLMVDVCDVGEAYSVQRFQADARTCVDGLLAQGKVPVLCGGTGLYLDAVIDEGMDFPAGMEGSEARRRYEAYAEERGEEALHDLLAERDPASAALIHPHNVRRVVRALELSDEGVSYADHHQGLKDHRPHYQTLLFAIGMDRQRLYGRIDERVDRMYEAGLVDEAARLRGRGLEGSVTASQAIGYREALDLLDGRISEDEARDRTKTRTRRYAKRQLSWLRRDGRARWLEYEIIDEDKAVAAVMEAVREAQAERTDGKVEVGV